jgi:hypothetical protein
MIRATAGAVLLLASIPIDAHAQRTPQVATDCTVEQAVYAVYFQTLERSAELSKQQRPILNGLKTINEKARDPNRPVGEQLSRSDVAEFARLQQRSETGQLYILLESGLGRDAQVIGRMFSVVNNLYIGRPEPREGAEDYQYSLFVAVLQMTSSRDDLKGTINTPSDLSACNIETALHLVEYESLQKLNSLDIRGGLSQLQAIMARNHMTGKIDRARLTPQDRALVDHIQRNIIAPATREEAFIGDLENLKDLWKAAQLQYEVNKKDIIDSVGDISSVGKTLTAMKLSTRTRFFVGVLDKIAESRQLQLISRARDQLESSQKR